MPRNGLGFLANDYSDLDRPRDGTAGYSGQARPRANPLAAQLATILIGGTATDGNYVAAFTLPDGTELTATVTRAAALPLTNADIATAMVAVIAADDAWTNVSAAVVDGGTPEQVNLTFIHAAIAYPLGTSSAPAPGTLVQAITQAAGGAPIPVGRFLIAVPNGQDAEIPAAGLPLVGSTAPQITGISVRPHGEIVNTESTDPDDVESWLAGDMIGEGYDGSFYMTNVGSVASAQHGNVFAVINPAGGDGEGAARSDADGGNTVQLTQAQAYWRDVVQPGDRGLVHVRM